MKSIMNKIIPTALLALCLLLSACFQNLKADKTTATVFQTMAKVVNIADTALKTAYAIRGPAIRKSDGFHAAATSCPVGSPDQCGIDAALAYYDGEIKKYDQARDAISGARKALGEITKAIDAKEKPVAEAVVDAVDAVVGTTQAVKGLTGVTIPPEMNTTLSAVCIVVKSMSTKPTKCTVVEGSQ